MTRRRRLLGPVILVVFQFCLSMGLVQPAGAAEPDFDVAARAAVLMDANTGQVLYAKNPNERLAPASLAKIMTMLLALEAIDAGRVTLDDTIEVSRSAWELALQARVGGVSGMFIEVGDHVSLEDLLYGVGVSSGNDASVALAEMLAGSEPAFVQQMNQRAAELGLNDTHFVDSHGLSAEAYTTALDMARLASFFVQTQHDGLIYSSREEFTYNGIRQENRNGLLKRDERVTGLKTGHLSVAGYHLVATAEDGEMSLVAAVLGADSIRAREDVAIQLLNYGFDTFRTITPAWGTGGQKEVRVYKGSQASIAIRPAGRIIVTLPADQTDQLAIKENLPAYVVAPIEEGEVVGSLQVTVDGDELAQFDLVAVEAVPRGGIVRVVLDTIRLFFSDLISRFTS